MKCLELFGGAGGLTFALASSGVRSITAVEREHCPVATLLQNLELFQAQGCDLDVYHADAKDHLTLKFATELGADLVAAGPPCQPFSKGGKQKGRADARDLFPRLLEYIARLKPKGIIVENVFGLGHANLQGYLAEITKSLERPGARGPVYKVSARCLNAADFGTPQVRKRLFFVGIRADIKRAFEWPEPTHSRERLVWDKWVSRDYWTIHKVRKMPAERTKWEQRIERDIASGRRPPLRRWLTVADVLRTIEPPSAARSDDPLHYIWGPSRSYPGHTGSGLDLPAKTIKAGVHGVPGGENMIRLRDDSIRYFSLRECAMVQGFPKDYLFDGSFTQKVRQIGNAVPPPLGKAVVKRLLETIQR